MIFNPRYRALSPTTQHTWQMGSTTGSLGLSHRVQYQVGKLNPLEFPFQPLQVVGVQVGSSEIS
jgi:hypothetical protein